MKETGQTYRWKVVADNTASNPQHTLDFSWAQFDLKLDYPDITTTHSSL
jgi:hypothetical protein